VLALERRYLRGVEQALCLFPGQPAPGSLPLGSHPFHGLDPVGSRFGQGFVLGKFPPKLADHREPLIDASRTRPGIPQLGSIPLHIGLVQPIHSDLGAPTKKVSRRSAIRPLGVHRVYAVKHDLDKRLFPSRKGDPAILVNCREVFACHLSPFALAR
jgi:hypothetical protein